MEGFVHEHSRTFPAGGAITLEVVRKIPACATIVTHRIVCDLQKLKVTLAECGLAVGASEKQVAPAAAATDEPVGDVAAHRVVLAAAIVLTQRWLQGAFVDVDLTVHAFVTNPGDRQPPMRNFKFLIFFPRHMQCGSLTVSVSYQ